MKCQRCGSTKKVVNELCKKCSRLKKNKERQAENKLANTPERKADYHEYLRSEQWQAVRLKAFEHYGRKCLTCGKTENLHVHHNSYKNFKNESLKDVRVLCEKCHDEVHAKIKNRQAISQSQKEAKKKNAIKEVLQYKKNKKQPVYDKPAQKKKEAKFCLNCQHNKEGFCNKFKRFATLARAECQKPIFVPAPVAINKLPDDLFRARQEELKKQQPAIAKIKVKKVKKCLR